MLVYRLFSTIRFGEFDDYKSTCYNSTYEIRCRKRRFLSLFQHAVFYFIFF